MSTHRLTQQTEPLAQSALTRLLIRKLMPLLVVVYVISFLDRTNIALARHTMSIDLGLSAAAYGLGAGLFFLTYALLEIPSNLVMNKVGARMWITRIMVTWGLLSIGMAFVRGETSFYVMRLLLGAAEAGLFPGVMRYLTYWFTREERALATGYFLIGVCVANIVGGPLGGALLELDGMLGLRGWQWLFVIEGLPAVLLAIVVWKMLPDKPSDAAWLSTTQAVEIEARLNVERDAQAGDGRASHSLRHALSDPQVWLAILVYFCHQLTIYTTIFFLPGVIGASGHFSPLVVGTLSATPWIAAAIGAAALPRHASTSARSRLLLVGGLVVMALGLLIAAHSRPVIGLLGMCVAAFMFFVVQSIIFTFPSSRLSGAALAGGLALVNSCGLLGGFVGPTVMGLNRAVDGQRHQRPCRSGCRTDRRSGVQSSLAARRRGSTCAYRVRPGREKGNITFVWRLTSREKQAEWQACNGLLSPANELRLTGLYCTRLLHVSSDMDLARLQAGFFLSSTANTTMTGRITDGEARERLIIWIRRRMDEFGITFEALAASIQHDLDNPPIYRDAKGNDWNGLGDMPDWLRAAKNAGVDPAFFRIESKPEPTPAHSAARYVQANLFE